MSPTATGRDVQSSLESEKSDTLHDVDVNVTVISIGNSETEANVPLNLKTEVKEEANSSACSMSKVYSYTPMYSQVQTEDCQSVLCLNFLQ